MFHGSNPIISWNKPKKNKNNILVYIYIYVMTDMVPWGNIG